jgi:hypothetical protein
MTSTATTATPKIVGKALYLELVPDSSLPEDDLRGLLGWQYNGVRQLIMFPEYQDDTGKTYGAVIMTRTLTTFTPKAQWDFTYAESLRIKEGEVGEGHASHYVDYKHYSHAEWAELSEREKFDSRKRAMALTLKNQLVSTCYATDENGERVSVAKQGYVVREGKPISVEVTDQDLNDIHNHRKTPQAVIRRINKVRDTLDKFPEKLV